ncbi:hypothetical protein LZ554_007913 [Drepanopeziza brunnea f. sp. 'monogermtubi']|nr:hypothetical protein LZ554_007913 [Drepanopeziza brunnea f. sp. 'monogermtubi']
MRLAIFSSLALVAVAAAVTSPLKSVIVSYPDNTPDSVLNQAKSAIKTAGGFITHEYHLFKGFAANAPAKALETVSTLNTDYLATVEEDQMVSVNNAL